MRAFVGLPYALIGCKHGAGLSELDLHRVRVAARYAFERAHIVVRVVGWLNARELRERPAFRAKRAVQLNLIDDTRL